MRWGRGRASASTGPARAGGSDSSRRNSLSISNSARRSERTSAEPGAAAAGGPGEPLNPRKAVLPPGAELTQHHVLISLQNASGNLRRYLEEGDEVPLA